MSYTTTHIGSLGFYLLTAGGAGFALVHELRELRRAFASRHWPVGEAEIVRSEIVERKGRRPEFAPLIAFRYHHEGREYIGNRLVFGGLQSSSREDPTRLVARFRPGTRWQVHIHRTRPVLSVLDPGPHAGNWVVVGFLIAFIALMGVELVTDPRRGDAAPAPALPSRPALESFQRREEH